MMKIAMLSLMVLGAAGAGLPAYVDGQQALAPGVQEQQSPQESADADKLYDLVKQARAELRELRAKAGLGTYTPGSRPRQREGHDGSEGADEHGGTEVRGEIGEHGGREHGGREHGGSVRGGEEGSAYLPTMTKQNKLFANGARLVLQFDPKTQVFVGAVTNTTARILPQVRVEVHLDNGTELGPTQRIDVGPGQTVPVELGTFGNEFNSWVSHPEAGVERGHGVGGEGTGEHGGREGHGEGRGEHGACENVRPRGAAYRPLYNQLQILRGEIHALEVDLGAWSG